MNKAFQWAILYKQIHTDVAIVRATRKEKKEIVRIMQDVFYKTDPSSVYSRVSEIPIVSFPIQEMSVESLNDNLSFIAKDKNKDKIFGAVINGIRPVSLKANYLKDLLKQIKSKKEKTLLELWSYVSTMPPDSEKYFEGEKNVFEIRFLVVDPERRNQGIARALVKTSRKEAAEKGFKFIRVDCTSHFTARIASAAGLDCIYKINYKDYRDPTGAHVFQNVIYPHTEISVYAGKSCC